ncbi:hypothetical protein H632_c3186p0 [Helicosporidium sp. ATCC 50920]|nr:hypothetical protein H632_c3186p0 [Helicosporidium sp. ATCC 50920]|eukprot:KDD72565.1 hypothetical protein H632_c3186p0 [Helicosporidium sp. ATCC 50920]
MAPLATKHAWLHPLHWIDEEQQPWLCLADEESFDDDSASPCPAFAPLPLSTSQPNTRSAELASSAVHLGGCPPPRLPEFAFVGRSNVGKSSLINLLAQRKNLARTSQTPGKTQTINHFLIDEKWYLVDLPGYGYARASRSRSLEWNAFTRAYLARRETLVAALLLVDASIPPLDVDVQCAAWFQQSRIPYALVFTKLDKRPKGRASERPSARKHIQAFARMLASLGAELPPAFETSCARKQGRDALLGFVARLCREHAETGGAGA